MKRHNGFNGLLSPRIFFVAVIFGAGSLIGLLVIINWFRPPRVPVGIVTAALTIVPLPTSTLTPSPTPQMATQNPDEPPPPPEGQLDIGGFVKISGTEGSGLRLREWPGLDYQPRFLGMEDEVFQIRDGPKVADGYTWWYLVAPFESDRNGWAVSNYLMVIQEP
jgi:hypothetical protein